MPKKIKKEIIKKNIKKDTKNTKKKPKNSKMSIKNQKGGVSPPAPSTPENIPRSTNRNEIIERNRINNVQSSSNSSQITVNSSTPPTIRTRRANVSSSSNSNAPRNTRFNQLPPSVSLLRPRRAPTNNRLNTNIITLPPSVSLFGTRRANVSSSSNSNAPRNSRLNANVSSSNNSSPGIPRYASSYRGPSGLSRGITLMSNTNSNASSSDPSSFSVHSSNSNTYTNRNYLPPPTRRLSRIPSESLILTSNISGTSRTSNTVPSNLLNIFENIRVNSSSNGSPPRQMPRIHQNINNSNTNSNTSSNTPPVQFDRLRTVV